jgi:uncharacterized protein YbjT (DUF2867 family)
MSQAIAIAPTYDEHNGKTYNLNGPDVLSGPKKAAIWSGLLGKEIRYPGEDRGAFEAPMRQRVPGFARRR